MRYAWEAAQKYPISKILASLPLPLAGTQLFEKLRKHPRIKQDYSGDLDRDDSFDYRRLVELQCQYFTEVTMDQMLGYMDKTKKLITGFTSTWDIN